MSGKTKTERLWDLFKQRGKKGVTCHDSVKYAGYHRLSAFVYKMRSEGYEIRSVMESDRDGGQYARYWLEEPEGQEKSAETLTRNSA